ncbi:uncharacterized protein EI90DRAFT_3015361 [Cantharellus anzutake]|uniref:uncharacterized protein n=1 Tax=Cantharellus anzutake TaxID=1750568 RepID=UPI001903F0B9|nr:uncharacterized protein EI90DRAFT_3015361 [Cantharellus anzutake]KAF8333469.1 hypothetical protein EI90DRAFT_3015361 [Cantharellus anzutake]
MANALRRNIQRLLTAGGDMAIPILVTINAASDVCPPLKSATNCALFIFEEVQKFKSDTREWTEFGKCVVVVVADVLAAIESYDASTEEAKPWLENVKKLDACHRSSVAWLPHLRDTRQRSKTEIEPIFGKMRGAIDGLKKVLDKALAVTLPPSFSTLTTGAKLTDIANSQDRLNRWLESDSVLSKPQYPTVAHHDPAAACQEGTRTDLIGRIMTWCRDMEGSADRVMLLTAVAGAGKTSIAHSIAEKCASKGSLLLTFFFKAGEQPRPGHLFSGMARSLPVISRQVFERDIKSIVRYRALAKSWTLMYLFGWPARTKEYKVAHNMKLREVLSAA